MSSFLGEKYDGGLGGEEFFPGFFAAVILKASAHCNEHREGLVELRQNFLPLQPIREQNRLLWTGKWVVRSSVKMRRPNMSESEEQNKEF